MSKRATKYLIAVIVFYLLNFAYFYKSEKNKQEIQGYTVEYNNQQLKTK
jgi:hypothetical protein